MLTDACLAAQKKGLLDGVRFVGRGRYRSGSSSSSSTRLVGVRTYRSVSALSIVTVGTHMMTDSWSQYSSVGWLCA